LLDQFFRRLLGRRAFPPISGTFPHKDNLSQKRFCLVPPTWNSQFVHRCDDRSHRHLSIAQVRELEFAGVIEWIEKPSHNQRRGVVRISRTFVYRGLSARVGAPLVEALCKGQGWARVMLAEIRLTRSTESYETRAAS